MARATATSGSTSNVRPDRVHPDEGAQSQAEQDAQVLFEILQGTAIQSQTPPGKIDMVMTVRLLCEAGAFDSASDAREALSQSVQGLLSCIAQSSYRPLWEESPLFAELRKLAEEDNEDILSVSSLEELDLTAAEKDDLSDEEQRRTVLISRRAIKGLSRLRPKPESESSSRTSASADDEDSSSSAPESEPPVKRTKLDSPYLHSDDGLSVTEDPEIAALLGLPHKSSNGANAQLANQPSDTWMCTVPGCKKKFGNANTPVGSKRIRAHYAGHGDVLPEKESLVIEETVPGQSISHLMARIRQVAADKGEQKAS